MVGGGGSGCSNRQGATKQCLLREALRREQLKLVVGGLVREREGDTSVGGRDQFLLQLCWRKKFD